MINLGGCVLEDEKASEEGIVHLCGCWTLPTEKLRPSCTNARAELILELKSNEPESFSEILSVL